MLERARAKAEADAIDATFIEGRPLDLALERDHYGLVLFPLDVFLYCASGEEQLATLRSLSETLVYNGLLALDLRGRRRGSIRTRTGSRCSSFRVKAKPESSSTATTCMKTTSRCKSGICA
jgi:hypothetical protein